MANTYSVYTHIKTDTNEVFYVGMSMHGIIRARSKWGRPEGWYNIVNKVGWRYEIVAALLTKEQAMKIECEFIQKYKKFCDGGTLCNINNGSQLNKHKFSTTLNIYGENAELIRGIVERKMKADNRDNYNNTIEAIIIEYGIMKDYI